MKSRRNERVNIVVLRKRNRKEQKINNVVMREGMGDMKNRMKY
jgi:hypothetical protein